jgi:hypothetical protein
MPTPRRDTDPTAVTDPSTGRAFEKSAADTGIVMKVVVNTSPNATSLRKSQNRMRKNLLV